VIIMAGRPLTFEQDCERARALLYAWHPGTMAGPAIVDVLFGDVAPSGKLPISFPRTVGQVPIYYNFKNTGRPPRNEFRGIPQGSPLDPVDMDASYLDVEVTPQFPFGFGLSYTTFEYSEITVSPGSAGLAGSFEVSALVRNAGSRAGVEVAQLYVRDLVGSVTRPVRELKGFQRVEIGAGESRRVTFQLPASELAFSGRDLRVRAEPGMFEAYVGGDCRASLKAEFELHDG
jgi:beta-glucosidase